MADEELTILARIKSTFDSGGFNQTNTALDSVRSKIQQLESTNKSLNNEMSKIANVKKMASQNPLASAGFQQSQAYKDMLNRESSYVAQVQGNSKKIGGLKKEEAKLVKQANKEIANSNKQVGESYSKIGGAISNAMGFVGGMIGYELVSGLVEAGRQAINASQQFDYFAGRLGKSKSDTEAFRDSVKNLQKDFKKVNMESVGATAMDIAVRNGLKGSNDELSEIAQLTAVMASEFKRNGRTEEDSILAVNDALDGQFRRLQEIGIKQEDLIKNGWNGDLNDKMGLVRALNKTMTDMGYDKTAKDITNLDDAWAALTVSGGNLLKEVLLPMMPAFLGIINGLTDLVSGFSKMPQEFKNLVAYGIAGAGALLVLAKAVGSVKGALGGLQGFTGIFGKVFGGAGKVGGAGTGGSEAGGKGIVATLQGLKGFGRALLGLVPDIIMATAAIAVVIACIFALAAEVIVLAKGLQMLIDAMKFGDIDLNDDIEGLKKLGDAMIQIAIVLGAMTLANIGAITSNVTGGVLALAVGLKTIKDSYKQVADAINEMKNMGDIDQAGLDKLKKLGESMKAIGQVAQGLNDVNQGMNLGSAINGFVAWFTGGEADIGTNISNLINKTREIAPKFSELSSLPDIDQSGIDKIQKVGDAMQHLGQVASGLQGVQGGFVGAFMDWWQGNVAEQVGKAVDMVKQIGGKLQGLGAINIPDMGWIDRVAVGLSSLKNAGTQLNGFAGLAISPDVATNVGNAVTAVKNIATQLSGLSGENIGDVSSILGQIQTAIQSMKDALNNANFNAEGVNIGTSLTTGVQSGLAGLGGVVNDACNQATSTAQSVLPAGFGSAASNATNSFRDNLKLGDIANAEMDYAIQAVNNKSGALAQAAANAAKEAVQAAKNASGQKSPGYIAQSWGREFGEYSPMKIKEGASKLISAVKTVTGSAVNAWKGALPFSSTNTVGALSTGLNTPYTSANTGNMGSKIINVGEGAVIIQVSEMTAQECRGILMEALDTL